MFRYTKTTCRIEVIVLEIITAEQFRTEELSSMNSANTLVQLLKKT